MMVKEVTELTEAELEKIVQKFKHEIRTERGMTQRFVATKTDIDETYLSDLLNGYKPLTDNVRTKLNEFLGTKY